MPRREKRPVIQYTKADSMIARFRSINEAERVTEISQSSISKAANGKRMTAGGFIWRFQNGRNENI
jgi:hypothetical protein